MNRSVFTAVFALSAIATAGHAAEVTREMTVDASPQEVWAFVGPFCAIKDWYPGIDSCAEEKIDGATHRRLMGGDTEFLEKRLASDEAGKSYSYAIIEGPLPVKDYTATFAVEDEGDQSLVIWTSTFEPDGVSEAEAVDAITGVYDTGLEAIKEHFAQ